MDCPTCKGSMHKAQVKKEGDNKGRWFYSCDDDDCRGFKWANGEQKQTKDGQEQAKPDWDANNRRMVRMHTQKVAGTIVVKWMGTEKALEEWASGFSTEGGQVVDLVKKIAHKLEDDVYRE